MRCHRPGHPPLPAAESLPDDEDDPDAKKELDKLYAGDPAVTYDADRRVGCTWTVQTPEGSRQLTLDFERVVSYDVTVSDDDRATSVYDKKATAAHVPAGTGAPETAVRRPPPRAARRVTSPRTASPPTTSPPTTKPPGTSPGPPRRKAGREAGRGRAPGPSPLRHRRRGRRRRRRRGECHRAAPLDDLGDEAYLDDKLATKGKQVKRKITVVFRSSNVIATITYDQASNDKTRVPSSEELQGKALELGGELTGRLNE
ncbi:hypothetical protein NKH77_30105 [Streptomyces sp. M19]